MNDKIESAALRTWVAPKIETLELQNTERFSRLGNDGGNFVDSKRS